MVDPVQGSGPIDPSQQTDQNQKLTEKEKYKEYLKSLDEESNSDKKINIDPKLHPLAGWFIDKWGWPPAKALAAEKQFLNNIMKQCQHLLNKYKHVYKKLDPNYTDNQ